MTVANDISFTKVDKKFIPKARGVKEVQIQNSTPDHDCAQGRLRMESVGNARYGKKHPILTKNGETVGAVKDGFRSVGYTYCFVYSDVAAAFAITHSYFRSTKDCLSFLGPDGRFGLFDSTPKFMPLNTIVLGSGWNDQTKGFMLLREGERLVIVSSVGIATVDMRNRSLVGMIEFERTGYDLVCDMSPVVDNIAVAACSYLHDDPVTGEPKYENYLRVYDVYEGRLLGETDLGSLNRGWQQLRYSDCGRYLNVICKEENIVLEMTS
ncbi:MAG: hypothetical protein ACRBDL_02305 [Alphaproteobacteria bacterium]